MSLSYQAAEHIVGEERNAHEIADFLGQIDVDTEYRGHRTFGNQPACVEAPAHVEGLELLFPDARSVEIIHLTVQARDVFHRDRVVAVGGVLTLLPFDAGCQRDDETDSRNVVRDTQVGRR
mgnify:CR=1 FL=1